MTSQSAERVPQCIPLPYVRQQQIDGHRRTCGVAALAAIYQSFGLHIDQTSMWRRLRETGLGSEPVIRSHRLAHDALSQGLSAACLRVANRPMVVLGDLLRSGWRVIVNHRHDQESDEGHFSVLAEVKADVVMLHDPWFGPRQSRSVEDFLASWWSSPPESEIGGAILVAINALPIARDSVAACPVCGEGFPLPGELGLGWLSRWSSCWRAAHCPNCDAYAAPPAIAKQQVT